MKRYCAGVVLLFTAGLVHSAEPKIEWTTDLSKMKFPDAPVSGMVRGGPFKIEYAEHGITGTLRIVHGKGNGDAYISVHLPIKNTAELAGMKFEIEAKGDAMTSPALHVKRKPNPKSLPEGEVYTKGYAMRLEFGDNKDGKIMGKIYVCVPDKDKSVIAGTFTVQVLQ